MALVVFVTGLLKISTLRLRRRNASLAQSQTIKLVVVPDPDPTQEEGTANEI